MTDFTYCDNLFSDYHKEAYGFRPTALGFQEWNNMSPEEKQDMWNSLGDTVDRALAAADIAKDFAIVDFNTELATIISYGAGDRATALRWMTQDTEFFGKQDVEQFVWGMGLLFTPEGKALVEELDEMVVYKEWL